MASTIKGLAGIRALQQQNKEKAEAQNRPKAEWFKWPKGVTSATVRFLQELDPEMENYREDRGIGLIEVEHQAPGPEGYKRRASCTNGEDGECYACERHKQDYKAGWRQRQNLYINAIVDFGDGDKKVLVLSRNANASFTQALIEEAVDEGSITDANYRITKTGEGTTTQWLLKRLKGEPMDDSKAEPFSIEETVLRKIPYEKQAEYYGAVLDEGTAGADSAPASGSNSGATASDDEW
jgi:hypothetical protein